jgi:hypothetical protein
MGFLNSHRLAMHFLHQHLLLLVSSSRSLFHNLSPELLPETQLQLHSQLYMDHMALPLWASILVQLYPLEALLVTMIYLHFS